MMNVLDIAGIVFACTAANHLGLVGAVGAVIRHRLPIVSCVKCFSFWAVICYCLVGGLGVIKSLAISFLCAWSAIWLDLLMGIIDKLYLKIYGKIYPATDTADTDALSAADAVSDVRKKDQRCRSAAAGKNH